MPVRLTVGGTGGGAEGLEQATKIRSTTRLSADLYADMFALQRGRLERRVMALDLLGRP